MANGQKKVLDFLLEGNMVEQTKSKEEKKKNAVGTRGRIFQGFVTKKFENRIVIEFERTVKIPKYERFAKKKTKLHARMHEGIDVHIGDLVKVQECRPLSKIVNFVVVEKVRGVGK